MIINQTFTIPGAEGKPILIDLTYKTGNERAPLVLFVHGFKGFKDWWDPLESTCRHASLSIL